MEKQIISPPQANSESPFLKLLNIHCSEVGEGKSEINFLLKNEHKNSWGVAHGGIILTLLDVAMAVAAKSSDRSGRSPLTLGLQANFLGVITSEEIKVIAETIKLTTTMAFTEAKLYSNNLLCASGTANFKFFKQKN